MDQVSDFVIAFLQSEGLQPDSILGVPDGATKLGVITQFKWAKTQPDYHSGSSVLPMWRKTPKQHGSIQDRHCIGIPHGNIILLEDVITTGGSLIEMLEQLKQLPIKIIATVSLTDRKTRREDGKDIKQILAEHDIPYYSMSNAISLLPDAYHKRQPGEEIGLKIEQELKDYNTEQIDLVSSK